MPLGSKPKIALMGLASLKPECQGMWSCFVARNEHSNCLNHLKEIRETLRRNQQYWSTVGRHDQSMGICHHPAFDSYGEIMTSDAMKISTIKFLNVSSPVFLKVAFPAPARQCQNLTQSSSVSTAKQRRSGHAAGGCVYSLTAALFLQRGGCLPTSGSLAFFCRAGGSQTLLAACRT